MSNIEVGSVIEGVVKGITKFGAFVELPGGSTGLVHISEVADTYVTDVSKFLKEKDKVRVKVLNVGEGGKIGLSIKQADPNYNPRSKARPRRNTQDTFEDKITKFMKESDEKQADLRKNTDSKRGGSGRF